MSNSCTLALAAVLLALLVTTQATAAEALLLEYLEREPGGPPYATRVFITPRFFRQDFGPDDSGFVLFDRETGTVYSVNADDRSILEITPSRQTIGAAPIPLELGERSHQDADAPLVAGRPPLFTEYTANGEVCYRTVSVPGLLPDAVAAWSEFRGVMALQRAATLDGTPEEFRSSCVLANSIFAPLRYLNHGLPIREDNLVGLSRELRSYEPATEVEDGLFRLPQGYRRVPIGDAGL